MTKKINVKKIMKISLINIVLTILILVTVKSYSQEEIVVDEIVAVVGKHIVLKSNIETQYLQYRMQNGITGSESTIKCSIIENLLYEKLLLFAGDVDSIDVAENEINQSLDMRLRYYVNQFGSEDKMAEYYHKPLEKIKEELREIVKEQLISQKVSNEITKGITITPSDVRAFFRKIPKDSIPTINPIVEIDQIVRIPPISKEYKKSVYDRLNGLRERILKGEKFETLAILYSEDPGSAKKGGELGLTKRGAWYPEFEATAFSLKQGDISNIIETEAGYHIVQSINRRGEFVNVRHILLMVKPSPEDLVSAASFIDSIATLIKSDSITFENAVLRFSDDPNRINLGAVVNPNTLSSTFDISELEPAVAFVVEKMAIGDISAPISHKTDDGKAAYKIIRLKSRTDAHVASLTDDYDIIQRWALQDKNEGVISEWIKDRISTTYIRLDKEYQGCEFEHKWL
ncbi:MAG: peptidylprolyl isomerase [Bacteroidetes bacterium]|nr:peptidylprolyl isomerase [Bacteroidota bacterium]